MAAPKYFQTEDEKQMAAIRANPSGRPTQMVRPMLPAGPKWQPEPGDYAYARQDTSRGERRIGGFQSNTSYMNRLIAEGLPIDQKQIDELKPEYALPRWGMGTPMAQRGVGEMQGPPNPYGPGTAPTPQDIAEMEKAGTADMSPRFSPIEMRGSTLNAWQSGALESPIAKTDPYGTMLNDRPGGGRTYESPFLQPRPMGSGTLSQRPTSTASGASERVAARRAIRMNPKSTEVAQRFARGIGGARNNDSWAP